jgi:hypothetical protein
MKKCDDSEIISKTTEIIPGNYPEIWEKIPFDVKQLLFYSAEMPPNNLDRIGIKLSFSFPDGIKTEPLGTKHDPSTIYFPLPIAVPQNLSDVPPPPRYPKYYNLLPAQKYIYLEWLHNVDRLIHEGYRHLFLFGLERQLIIGNFDAAWEMILRLRNIPTEWHDLFVVHATDTLFTACMMNRKDLFPKMFFLFDEPRWGDMQILTKYYTHEPIEAFETMKILNYTDTKNRRYIDNAPNVYAKEMSQILQEKTGRSFISAEDFISEEKQKKSHIILGFHNTSFPFELRNPNILLPDTSPLTDFLHLIHIECHERTKLRLRRMGKN